MTRIRTTITAFAAGTLLVAALAGAAGAADTGNAKKPVVTIGVIAPLNAGLTSFGQGIRDSVKLAVQTAVDDNLVPGVTLKVRALDDSSDPAIGARAAKNADSQASAACFASALADPTALTARSSAVADMVRGRRPSSFESACSAIAQSRDSGKYQAVTPCSSRGSVQGAVMAGPSGDLSQGSTRARSGRVVAAARDIPVPRCNAAL